MVPGSREERQVPNRTFQKVLMKSPEEKETI
jgi:hypothetical protein